MGPNKRLTDNLPLIAGLSATIICIIISIISLETGWVSIFQNLFYIPIIIVCIYYTTRGFAFSLVISLIYYIIFALMAPDPNLLFGAFLRTILFIVVAAITTFIASIHQKTTNAIRESEARIRIDEQRLRSSQTLAHVGSWEYDIRTRRIWGSDEAYRIYGLTPSSDGTITLEEVEACVIDKGTVHQAFIDFLEGRNPYDIEIAINAADHSGKKIVHSIAELVKDDDGTPTRVIGLLQDITRQKQAEIAIRESKEQFTAFMERLPAAAFVKDEHGMTLFVNPYLQDLMGITQYEGKTTPEMVKGTTGVQMALDDRQVLREGPLEKEETVTDSHGVTRTFKTLKFPIRIEGRGTLLGGISIDVTGQKRMEEALRESEAKFSVIYERSSNAISLCRVRDRTLVDVNAAWLSLYGFSRDEAIGKTTEELGLSRDPEIREDLYQELRERGFIRNREITSYYTKSSTNPVLLVNQDIVEIGGEDYILTSVLDITERHRSEAALNLARKKLHILDTLTSQDLKNAVFTLSAYFSLTDQSTGSGKAFFGKEEEVIKTISNILSFAEDYQNMGLKPAHWQSVEEVFIYAISHLQFLTGSRTIILDGLEVFADPLLERAFFHIMQFMTAQDRNSAEIKLHYRKNEEDITVTIEDTGQGIVPEDKDRIFERGFRKGDYGLFLAREILSITNMTIRETGIFGTGTRFEITIPQGSYRFRWR